MLTESEYHTNRTALVSRLTGKRRAYEEAALERQLGFEGDDLDALTREITTIEGDIKRLDAAMRARRRQSNTEAIGVGIRERRAALLHVDELTAEATFITAALSAAITQAGSVFVRLRQIEREILTTPHMTPRGREFMRDFGLFADGDIETLLAGAGLVSDGGLRADLDLVEAVTRRLARVRPIIRESLGITAADLNDDDATPVAA